MKHEVFGITVEQQSKFILTLGIFIMLIILYGLTNGFNAIEIPEEYKIMIGE